MKRLNNFLILMVFILFSNIIIAQNTKNTKPPLTLYTTESGNFIMDTVINVNDVSKEELYKRAKDWVVSTVRTSDQNVIFDDTDFNEIRTDITLNLTKFAGINKVNFKLSVFFKDNKCRIITESFIYLYIGSEAYEAPLDKLKTVRNKKTYKEFDIEFAKFKNSLIQSLYKAVDNDW